MKSFIYISLLTLGLFATSCTKEELVRTNTDLNDAPTWDTTSYEKKGGPVVDGSGDDEIVGESSSGQTGGVSPIDGDITDPNNDPDGKKKKY